MTRRTHSGERAVDRNGRGGDCETPGAMEKMRKQDQHLDRHSLTVASALALTISTTPSMPDSAGRNCTPCPISLGGSDISSSIQSIINTAVQCSAVLQGSPL